MQREHEDALILPFAPRPDQDTPSTWEETFWLGAIEVRIRVCRRRLELVAQERPPAPRPAG